MARPALRLRIVPRFPARIQASDGVRVDRTGGVVTIRQDWNSIAQEPAPSDPATYELLLRGPDGDLARVPGTPLVPASWSTLAGKPSEFPPEPHTHGIPDIINLQAALDAAADAVSPSNVPIYSSRAAAELLAIPPGINFVRVNGFSASGDTGSGGYRFAASEPAHTGKFQSADGRWWELAEYRPTLAMFGGVADGVTDCSTAFGNLIGYCRARGVTGRASGIIRLNTCNFDLTRVSLEGDGEAITYSDTIPGSATVLAVYDTTNPGFKIGHSTKLSKLSIMYPDQLGRATPIAYPPTFQFTGSSASGWDIRDVHVPCTYTLFSNPAATVVGAGVVDNVRAFALSCYFEFLGGAPEVILINNSIFSPGAWLGDYLTSRSGLLRHGYDNSVLLSMNIDTGASYRSIDGFTLGNSIVYGVRRLIDRVAGNIGPILFDGVHFDGIGQTLRARGDDFIAGLTFNSCVTYMGGPSDNSRMLNTINDPDIDIDIGGTLFSNFSLSGYSYHGLGSSVKLAGTGLRDVYIDSLERRNFGRSQTTGEYCVLDVDAPNATVSVGRLASANPNRVAGTTLIGVKVSSARAVSIGSLDLDGFDTGLKATETTPGTLIKRIDVGKASMVGVVTPIDTNLTSRQLCVSDLITDATGVTKRGRMNFSATNSSSFSVTTTLSEMLTATTRHDFGNDASGGRCIVGRAGPVSIRAKAAFSATAGVIVEMRVQVFATAGGGLRHSSVTQAVALSNNLGYLSIATDLNCVVGDEISLWFKTISGSATVPADAGLTCLSVTA